MSAQVNNNHFSSIGRMFARRNVPAVYGTQKSAAAAEAEAAPGQVDRVSLSSYAPKPLHAKDLEDALNTARTLGEGGKLPTDRIERLREDRIFAAVSVLAIMGEDGSETSIRKSWPGGLPVPTREEMEVARRRLSQRLRNVEEAADSEAVQQDRVELWRRIGKRDFSTLAVGEGVEATAAAS